MVVADRLEIVGDDAEGDAGAEVHQPGDVARGARAGGMTPKLAADLGFGRGRQRVEHRQMRRHLVALRRVMRAGEARRARRSRRGREARR